ncbi:MAG: MMPL family transporter [Chitinispirillaceae bacterium]|nr:MMPL family transporter [Chitinispirillaceae bacterium]
MREKFFRFLAYIVTIHNRKILICGILLTLFFIAVSGRLTFKTRIADMMPQGIPQIEEFLKIAEEYKSDFTVMITIESDKRDLKEMKNCAEELVPKLENIVLYKPKKEEKLSILQKIEILRGKFPVKGVEYDTIPLVKRVDYKIDKEFIEKHGLILQKNKDLKNMLNMYNSINILDFVKNINDNFEREYIEDSENLSSIDGEEQAIAGLEGIRKYIEHLNEFIKSGDTLQAIEAINAILSGDQYLISPDNSMLLVMVQPAVSMDQFEDAMFLGYRIDDTLSFIQQKYPHLNIGRSGAMMIQIDENNALVKDFGWSSLFSLLLILILLVGSFRNWKYPFFSVVVLTVGIIWTTGFIAIVYHYLSMISAAFAIILIGLGIDFGIHLMSGFRDGREQGKSLEESIYYMYNRVGAGIITGAFTTAIVFYILIFTKFKAFFELGTVIGSGILITLFAFLILLPAFIVWNNKEQKTKEGNIPISILYSKAKNKLASFFSRRIFTILSEPFQFKFLSASGKFTSRLPIAITIIIISSILVFLSIVNIKKIEFEYDMMKLEPVGLPSVICQDKILEKFEISPDFAMVRAKDLNECRKLVEEFKRVGNKTGLIGKIDAITEFLPEEEEQKRNIPLIENFKRKIDTLKISNVFTKEETKKLLEEFNRLHQNIVEIGELSVMSSGEKNKIVAKCDQIVGKSDEESKILKLIDNIKATPNKEELLGRFQYLTGREMKEKLLAMTSTEVVTMDNLPINIKSRYTNDNSTSLLINVYPKNYIWEERQLRKFNEATQKITDRITGLPILTMLMIDMMKEKGIIAIILGTIGIIFFLIIDFKSVKYTILALIPLATGTIWMIGLMALFKIKFSLVNFMAIPLIIGIGIDDGVHILHRYIIEGKNSIPVVIKYTGRAIILTSLTTMIGFGSMGLASHRGIASMGVVLFMGVGTCFIASAYLLPAILAIYEKLNINKEIKGGVK